MRIYVSILLVRYHFVSNGTTHWTAKTSIWRLIVCSWQQSGGDIKRNLRIKQHLGIIAVVNLFNVRKILHSARDCEEVSANIPRDANLDAQRSMCNSILKHNSTAITTRFIYVSKNRNVVINNEWGLVGDAVSGSRYWRRRTERSIC